MNSDIFAVLGLIPAQQQPPIKSAADLFKEQVVNRKPPSKKQAPQKPTGIKSPSQLFREQVTKPARARSIAAQEKRGGKSLSQINKETKGTWENSVVVARKLLGIVAGSEDDQFLKSALWAYRTQYDEANRKDVAAHVPHADLASVVKRMQSAEGRASLQRDIEGFRFVHGEVAEANKGRFAREPTDEEKSAAARQTKIWEMEAAGPGEAIKNFDEMDKQLAESPLFKAIGDALGGIATFLPGGKGAGGYSRAVAESAPSLLAALNPVSNIGRAVAHLQASVQAGMKGDIEGALVHTGLTLLTGSDVAAPAGIDTLGAALGKSLKSGKGVAGVARSIETDGLGKTVVALKKAGLSDAESANAIKAASRVPETGTRPVSVEFRKPSVGEAVSSEFREPVNKPLSVEFRPVRTEPAVTTKATTKAAQKPSVTSIEPQGFGAAHADTAAQRAELDMSQYVKTKKPLAEVVEQSKAIDPVRVAAEVTKTSRVMTDAEQASVLQRLHQNSLAQVDTLKSIKKAVQDGDTETAARMSATYDTIAEESRKMIEAADVSGTEWGRAGRARQIEVSSSNDADVLRYRWYKTTGSAPSDRFEAVLKELQELNSKVESMTEKTAKRQPAKTQQATKPTTPTIKASGKTTRYKRTTTEEGFRDAVKTWNRGGIRQSKTRGAVPALSEEQWNALKYIVRYHVDNGIEAVDRVIDAVIKTTGVDRLTAARATNEVMSSERNLSNTGRKVGETYMERGRAAIEDPALRDIRFKADRKAAEAKGLLHQAERAAKFRESSTAKKMASYLADALGTSRAILASGDLSAPFRQGSMMWYARPKESAKAFKNMLKSVKGAGYENVMWEITQSKHFNEAVSAKLALTDMHGGFLPHEEEFVSNLLRKVPGAKQLTSVSEQTYTAYLNSLRMGVFSSLVEGLESGGKALSREDLESLAYFVNAATGRGSLGKLEPAGDTMAKILFAPRYLAARVQMLSGAPLWKATKATRGTIAREMAKSYLGVLSVIGAVKMLEFVPESGVTVETDPRSSKFGRVQAGGNVYDMTGGLGQVATFASRMGSLAVASAPGMEDFAVRKTYQGRYSKRNEPFSDPGKMTLDFLAGKASPPVKVGYYGLRGKDYKGDDTSYGRELATSFVPIGIQSAYGRRDQDPKDQVLAAIMEFFGIGSSPAPSQNVASKGGK